VYTQKHILDFSHLFTCMKHAGLQVPTLLAPLN